MPPVDDARQQELLGAVRRGDQSAFEPLIAPYRAELHAHCYRMLGSVHDADDALQDALLRAWRGLARFQGRSSLRSWLYTIATNASLDLIAKRPKRVLPIDAPASGMEADGLGLPLNETAYLEPYASGDLAAGAASPEARYELRESVELAFVAAVQHLPALQRAVLILREVLGYSAREVAGTLETSVAAVNSALQRARKTISDLMPDRSQQSTLRALGDQRAQQLVSGYADAMARGDVDAVVGMLTADAAWSMPPLRSWFRGAAVPGFLALGPLSGRYRWRHVIGEANGQLASAAYTWHPEAGAYLPFALDVITLDGDRIADVTAFIARSTSDPSQFPHWPDAPPDEPMVERIFLRAGFPPRLDAE